MVKIYLPHTYHLHTYSSNNVVPTLPPQSPSAIIRDSRAFVCSWSPPPFEHQNGLIIEYRINVTEVITRHTFVRVSTGTSLVIMSLHPDYVYEWVVTAVTIGEGPYTTTSSIRMPEDGKQTKMTNDLFNTMRSNFTFQYLLPLHFHLESVF